MTIEHVVSEMSWHLSLPIWYIGLHSVFHLLELNSKNYDNEVRLFIMVLCGQYCVKQKLHLRFITRGLLNVIMITQRGNMVSSENLSVHFWKTHFGYGIQANIHGDNTKYNFIIDRRYGEADGKGPLLGTFSRHTVLGNVVISVIFALCNCLPMPQLQWWFS